MLASLERVCSSISCLCCCQRDYRYMQKLAMEIARTLKAGKARKVVLQIWIHYQFLSRQLYSITWWDCPVWALHLLAECLHTQREGYLQPANQMCWSPVSDRPSQLSPALQAIFVGWCTCIQNVKRVLRYFHITKSWRREIVTTQGVCITVSCLNFMIKVKLGERHASRLLQQSSWDFYPLTSESSLNLLRSRNCFSFWKSFPAVTPITTATAAKMAAPSIHSPLPNARSSTNETTPEMIRMITVRSLRALPASSSSETYNHSRWLLRPTWVPQWPVVTQSTFVCSISCCPLWELL